jgi:hypothetical protein
LERKSIAIRSKIFIGGWIESYYNCDRTGCELSEVQLIVISFYYAGTSLPVSSKLLLSRLSH